MKNALLLTLLGAALCAAAQATRGFLDLRSWNWASAPDLELDGEWEFYWDTLLTRFSVSDAPQYIQTPRAWNRDNRYPPFGCATYRLRVILPPERPALGIRVPAIANAATIYIDGRDIGQTGIPACSAIAMVPHWRDAVYAIPPSASDTLELVILASNFQTANGGLWNPVSLGIWTTVERKHAFYRALRVFTAGFLFLMALYHVILYLHQRKDAVHVFFCVISLVGAYRLLSPGDHLIREIIPRVPWEFFARMDFSLVGLSLILIYKFTEVLYPKTMKHPWIPWILRVAAAHAIACWIIPTQWLTPALIPAQWLYIITYAILLRGLIRALREHCEWTSAVHLGAMLLFLATIINDFLHAKQWIHTTYLASYGLVPVIVFQWFLIARGYSLTYNQAERRLRKFLRAMAQAIESKNRYTGDHVNRVSKIARLLAERLGLTTEQVQQIELGAIVHDIGKLHLSDDILNKPGSLSPEETELVRRHPQEGYQLLAKIEGLDIPRQIILYHHENWDGSGYPHGLKKSAIPLAARIVAIADFWDAITSDRSYRGAKNKEEALNILREEAGKRLDPQIVHRFISGAIADKV